MRTKKILIASDAFLPRWDGIARYLDEVIKGLWKDYDITVIAPQFPNYKNYVDNETRFRIIRVPTFNFTLGDYYPPKFAGKTVYKEVKRADMIWTHAVMPIGIAAIMSASILGRPCISTIHSIEWELARRALKEKGFITHMSVVISKLIGMFFYNRCDMLMVSSQNVADLLSWNRINSPKRIIKLATDTEKFRPALDKASAKINVGLKAKEFIIGYCGRLGREKDLGTLYRAFIRFTRKHDAKLLVVGDGIELYKKMFSRNKNVIMAGAQDNVVPYLQAMDIYVLPSLTETTSLSTLEAMSTGIPVIATQVGSVKQYIRNSVNGMFFTRQDHFSLYKKICYLHENPKVRDMLGQNARETVKSHYSWNSTIKSIKKVLELF
ncbi:glycosyltransferase family 4 protein [Candidatus Woesearchaeota archaeon]|nr:glycosyltransferase family 4 protein [Candidatus Woesearchaeota archaeon]